MYGKIFESIYDSSLVGDWKALVTFQQLIVLADKDGYVFHSVEGLSRKTSIPIEVISHGIEVLLQPDKRSQSPKEDGRRILRIPPDENGRQPHGWILINYSYYKSLISKEERKQYMKEYMRERRKKGDCKQSVNNCKQELTELTHIDIDIDKNSSSENPSKTTLWLQEPSIQIILSNLLFSLILKNNSNFKKPNLQTWAKHIDLMIRTDKRSPEEIKKVIEWCQQDEFWHTNILSIAKLRKQYDQLVIKMRSSKKKNKESSPYIPKCDHCKLEHPYLKKGKECPECGEIA